MNWVQILKLFRWLWLKNMFVLLKEENKELKTLTSYDQPRQHIKKQKHYFVNKGQSSQGYGFSSGHVWMWELDYKENWAQNWCFWTVVLEKILESPLDCKEIQPDQPMIGELRSHKQSMLWPKTRKIKEKLRNKTYKKEMKIWKRSN